MSEFLFHDIGLILEAKQGLAWLALRRDWQSIQEGSQNIGIDSSTSTALHWKAVWKMNEWMYFSQLCLNNCTLSKVKFPKWGFRSDDRRTILDSQRTFQ